MLSIILEKSQKEMYEDNRESFFHFRKYLCHNKQNIDRNINTKIASCKILEGNEIHVIGHCKKEFLVVEYQKMWLNYFLLLDGK